MQVKIEDRIRNAIRSRKYSAKTEDAYVAWYKKFVRFHGMTHPKDMGADHIQKFLDHLAVHDQVSASTHGQAKCAIVFLYRHVIGRDPGDFGELIAAKRNKRIPVVLSPDETMALLDQLNKNTDKQFYLMASLHRRLR